MNKVISGLLLGGLLIVSGCGYLPSLIKPFTAQTKQPLINVPIDTQKGDRSINIGTSKCANTFTGPTTISSQDKGVINEDILELIAVLAVYQIILNYIKKIIKKVKT